MAGEFVFVDAGVASIDQLLATIGVGYTVVLLTDEKPALEQMADSLRNTSDVAAIHLISHGGVGFLELSSGTMDSATLASTESQAALEAIKASLSDDGDILLYGCNIGYSETGAGFIRSLAEFTGADVAASTDLTGSIALGGDGLLEVNTGAVEARILDLSAYTSLLPASGMYYSTSGSHVNEYVYGDVDIVFNAISAIVSDATQPVKLIIHAYDIDYNAGSSAAEWDAVYISGPGLSETFVGYLVGTNNNWTYTTFDVSGIVNSSGNYTVKISPDVNNKGWAVRSDVVELFVGDGGYYITSLTQTGQSVSTLWNAGSDGAYTIQYLLVNAAGSGVAQANVNVTESDTGNASSNSASLSPNSTLGYFSWGDVPDGTYTLTATLFDSGGLVHDIVSISVNLSNDTTPPVISGPSGWAASVNENTTAVTTLSADETSTWSISGGADSGKFDINSSTGALTFKSARTFEIPTDSGADNGYVVTVKATDAAGNYSTQTLTVSVLNVIELGSIDITSATDSAADDTLTNNAHPVITFTGEPNLTITLKGPGNTTLAADQYSVVFTPGATNESGTYTVTLVDGKSGSGAANDPFGSYLSGIATGNPVATSADGIYTLMAADAYSHTATVGSFEIDTTLPRTSVYDMTDAFDSGNSQTDELTRTGLPVMTFTGEAGLTITLKGADGSLLNASQYSISVSSPPVSGNVTYTVTLVDANTATGGNQTFGTYNSLYAATGNPAASIDGTYTVVATDAAANTADVGTFIIDTTRAVPTVYDMANTRETGISLDDELTYNGKPILTFGAEAGLSVGLTGPNGTALQLGQHYSVAYSGGIYTVILLDSNLTNATSDPFGTYYRGTATGNSAATRDGTYTMSVTDAAGNIATVGTFEIDTAAPGVQVNAGSIDISNDTGASASDFNTSATVQTITATLSRALLADERLLGTLDGGKSWTDVTATASGTGVSWSTRFASSGEIRFKVQDAAGNDGIVRAQAFVLDTLKSANSVSNIDISNDTGFSATDFLTSAVAQTVTAQLSKAMIAGETLYGSLNGGTSWVDMSPYISGKAITWTSTTLVAGTSSIKFYFLDTAGNVTSETVQAYTVIPPAVSTLTITGIDLSIDSGTSDSDFLTGSSRQTISATLGNGPLNSAQKLYGSVDSGATWTDITTKISGTAISWNSVTLKSGSGNSIQFKVMDGAGNVATAATQAYTLDTTKPAVTPVITAISVDNGLLPNDFITSRATQDVTATLSSGLAGNKLMASKDGGTTWVNISSAVSGTTVHWTGVGLAAGRNTLMMQVVDDAGNVGGTAGKLVTVQNLASIATLDANKFEGNTGGSTPYTFTVSLESPALAAVTLNWAVKAYGTYGVTADDFETGASKALPSGQITIAAGASSGLISVPVYADTVFAQDQGFSVTLTRQQTDTSIVLGTAVAYGTILNDDALTGTASGNTLVGSGSSETISGLAGNDLIQGRGGDDTLVGGAGSDRFTFEATGAGNGYDTIDFTAGVGGDIFSFAAFMPGGAIDRHGAAGATAITPYLTADTGDANITGKFVLLDSGSSGLTVADIVGEIHGTGNAFSLNAGGKAIIMSGNAASASGAAEIFFINDALDGTNGTVTASDIVWVSTISAGIDLDTVATVNLLAM